MPIDLSFMEIAKRHNERFGTNYPTNLGDVELFFFSDGKDRAIGEAIMAQLAEQMKARLMSTPCENQTKNGDVFFYKFLTGVIVLGVTIASIVRATK